MKEAVPTAERILTEQEREANLFAMCLLMPEELVRKWIDKNGCDLDRADYEVLKQIAKAYGISVTQVAARLHDLGYL